MPIGAMATAGRQVFRILVRRLRDELEVNTTCGASNVSFGLPNRDGHQRRLPGDGDRRGLTSAITNPLARRDPARDHGRRRPASGNDPNCAPLDPRASATPPPEGERRRPAVDRRRTPDRAGRRLSARPRDVSATERSRSSSSRRRAGAAASRPARTVLDAARALGVDIDSVCGGRGICGRCQVESERRQLRQARHRRRAAEHLVRARRRSRREYRRRSAASQPDGASAARRTSAATSSSTCRPRARSTARSCARVRRRAPSSSTRWSASTTSRSSRARARVARRATCAGCWRRSSASGSSPASSCDLDVHARAPAGAAKRASGRSPSRSTTGRTSPPSGPASTSRRYGVAFDVGSTTIAGHLVRPRRAARSSRRAGVMNPQIRFGEDLMSRVSYAMMNPGGAGEMTAAVREALNGLIAEPGERGRDRARRRSSS